MGTPWLRPTGPKHAGDWLMTVRGASLWTVFFIGFKSA